jgi:hypothetical protein
VRALASVLFLQRAAYRVASLPELIHIGEINDSKYYFISLTAVSAGRVDQRVAELELTSGSLRSGYVGVADPATRLRERTAPRILIDVSAGRDLLEYLELVGQGI